MHLINLKSRVRVSDCFVVFKDKGHDLIVNPTEHTMYVLTEHMSMHVYGGIISASFHAAHTPHSMQ